MHGKITIEGDMSFVIRLQPQRSNFEPFKFHLSTAGQGFEFKSKDFSNGGTFICVPMHFPHMPQHRILPRENLKTNRTLAPIPHPS